MVFEASRLLAGILVSHSVQLRKIEDGFDGFTEYETWDDAEKSLA